MFSLRRSFRQLRTTGHRIVSQPVLRRVTADRDFVGSQHGGWWIWPRGLDRESVVYSVGVGRDISFDVELIRRFGLTVHAFDPTPRSVQWLKTASPPSRFRFYPIGLAPFDGIGAFNPPARSDFVSYSLTAFAATEGPIARCEVRRLETIARGLGHRRIDLLKLDIEGEEYAVIEDICRGSLKVTQLLVEFHGEQLLRRRRRIAMAARQLRGLNLVPFSISETGREYSFVTADLQERASDAELA
jgi:FkbM family methyltransferase